MIDHMAMSQGLSAYDIFDAASERGYDDIVGLACQICAAQSAAVSLIDGDHYCLKASRDIAPSQTEWVAALSKMALHRLAAIPASKAPPRNAEPQDTESRLVEIEDLATESRTAIPSLPPGAASFRFYAAVPLQTPFGVIGILTVLDRAPRPDGLSDLQRSALEKLARLVVDLLELGRQSKAYDNVQRHWRSLFQTMNEGFFLARLERDSQGCVKDWRYYEVNPAWISHTGIEASDIIGRTCREVLSWVEPCWIEMAATAVDQNRPVPFIQDAKALGRWFEGTFYPVGQDLFSVTFREITRQVESEKRQNGLVALGDVLRDERDIAVMTCKAMAVIGEALGADRATYGELDHDIETITVAEGWAMPDMPPIKGLYRFDDYGCLRPTLLEGEALVIHDIQTDPRTAAESESWRALNARGVINIPVREDGRNVALMLVHFARPHQWTSEEIHWLYNAADRLGVAIARRRADELQAVVNGEIAHRLRNTLAMVQAVARMTLRDALSKEEANRFYDRLQSLGRAHDMLHGDGQRTAYLGDLVANILCDASMRERCRLSGPVIRLGSRAAMSTALLIHEMTTNACKHGALSVPEGEIEITWALESLPEGLDLVLHWTERNGPPAIAPEHGGFGSRLISFGLIGTGGVVLRYESTGLSASFRADAEKIMRT